MKDINSGSIRSFEDITAGASDIVITTHMKPDGDAIGSSVAMYRFLKKNGKSPKIVINDSYPSYLSFLITPDMSDDLVIREANPQEAQEAILKSDLIICLDFNAFHRTDGLEKPLAEAKGRKILIDHHLNPSRELFDLSFSETEVSSASELVYHVLMHTSAVKGDASRLGKECAEAIMTGMTTDTNNFANSVFPSTLQMASGLLSAGVDREMILDRVYNQYGENRLRLMGHMMKVGLLPAPISRRVCFTTSICSSNPGCEISTTCSSRSASRTSSSVDLNDSTSCVGNLRMKPTVSESRNGRLSKTTLRTVVSSVAKSLFSANTSLLLSRFISVDLPTLV